MLPVCLLLVLFLRPPPPPRSLICKPSAHKRRSRGTKIKGVTLQASQPHQALLNLSIFSLASKLPRPVDIIVLIYTFFFNFFLVVIISRCTCQLKFKIKPKQLAPNIPKEPLAFSQSYKERGNMIKGSKK
jgi:hypothetical protein